MIIYGDTLLCPKGKFAHLTERMKTSGDLTPSLNILNGLPGIEEVSDITPQFWENRMEQN
jgi:hypothetical protein